MTQHMENEPQAELAKLFDDWIASPEGQAAIEDAIRSLISDTTQSD